MVGGVLQNVGSEMSKELARATQKRDVLQARLDAATTSKQRATLGQQLAQANVEVSKLQLAVDKLNTKVGDLTNSVPGSLTPPTRETPITFPSTGFPQGPFPGNDQVPTTMIISVVGLVFVGFPLALAFARLLWKRGNYTPPATASQLPADSTRRFDQLEHAVDAIAIEVERISENQRYLTKLLSEPRPNVAVGAGRGGSPPAS
jgi:uncharacterized coiled-coil protein SlyX